MTGRLFGHIELPPESPEHWNLSGGYYGCPLCYTLRRGDSRLYNSRNIPIDFKIHVQPRHSPSLDVEWLTKLSSSTTQLTICTSMGHIYAYQIELSDFNGYQPHAVNYLPPTLSILESDLPPEELVYSDGILYNRGATLVDVAGVSMLVGLGAINHKLEQALSEPELYKTERERFVYNLDSFITNSQTTNDSEYGYYATKLIVNNSQLVNADIPINKLSGEQAYGIMYHGQLNNEKLIYKYVRPGPLADMFLLEQRNTEWINANLDNRPDLPYPYTYLSSWCGEFDINEQRYPTCPPAGEHAYIGVFVQEYISGFASLTDAITSATPSEKLQMYIEAVATLAEAHQGDTVKYHFMHLDAHGGNFILSRCHDKTCALKPRVADLGGIKYSFNGYGYKVYMIDFGQSHFLDDEPVNSPTYEYDGVLGDAIVPVIDLLSLAKDVLPGMAGSMLNARGREWERFKKLLCITSCLLSKNTTAAFNMFNSVQDVGEIDYSNTKSIADRISSYHSLPDDVRQVKMLELVEHVFEAMERGSVDDVDDKVRLLIGMYVDNDSGYKLSKVIHGDIDRLSCDVMGIGQPPDDVHGLALYLYYLNEAGLI